MPHALKDTLIDMLRHGEPVGGRRYRGQTDDPLSEKGWRQMRAATAGERPWTAIVSSPLARCRAYAEELAGQTGLPLAFDERLKEVGFGRWEGRTADEIKAVDPDAVFNFKRDPVAFRPAGAEALDAFYDRVGAAYEAILKQHAGGHVLVVAHAGVIRMVICRVLGLSPVHAYHIQVGSAGIARFRVEQKGDQRYAALLHLTAGS
ncbi:MAG: alpha-ribazole phosphatase family protein [Gallionellaceae bacterium]|nr:alpha-ribazole phosphatase family protein [Gallionellaceae bacterium]